MNSRLRAIRHRRGGLTDTPAGLGKSAIFGLLGDLVETVAPVVANEVVRRVAKKIPGKYYAMLKLARKLGLDNRVRKSEAVADFLRGQGYQ